MATTSSTRKHGSSVSVDIPEGGAGERRLDTGKMPFDKAALNTGYVEAVGFTRCVAGPPQRLEVSVALCVSYCESRN